MRMRVSAAVSAVLLTAAFSLSGARLVEAQATPTVLMPESGLPPQKSTLVFGQKIVFYETGTGPTLVLVHGMASRARFDWGQVIGPLSKHYHVIALDQIGFGGSAKPQIDYSIQTFVDFLGEFLRTQKVSQFMLAGESLGGWISALYTIEALDPANTGTFALPKPSKLIIEDGAGMKALHIAGTVPLVGTLADAHGVAIVFHNKSLITDAMVRENFEMKLNANDGYTQRSFWANPKTVDEVVAGRLAKITIPTLVVWGADDELVSLEQGKAYAAGISGAKLVIVPDCGHAPSIEKPKEFLDAAEAFLK